MTVTYEQILAGMPIPADRDDSIPLPSVTRMRNMPECTTPQSIEDVNRILSWFSLPTFSADDSSLAMLDKLSQLRRTKPFDTLAIDEENLREHLILLEECRKNELLCDQREIELANLQVGVAGRFSSKTNEELGEMLRELERSLELESRMEEVKRIIDEIASNKDEAYQLLSFMKNETAPAYYWWMARDMLEGSQEYWCRVVIQVLDAEECQVEALGRRLQIERVHMLKIIYNLSSKNILEYNRLEDTIRLNRTSQK